MANRYSQYVQGVNYAPESFRDMSIVPIALRQRHDASLAAQDDMLMQLNNIQVRDEDKDYYNQKREEITKNVEDLTNKINTIGAGDSNLMGDFRNMKRSYNKEVSLAGGLGQAANIKKTVDQARANYLDFGVKQGWSPETAQKNFELEYNNYNTNNPSSSLGQDGFRFGEFNPVFAPKQINPVDSLKNIAPLIGNISKEEAFKNYKLVQDPNTGQYVYQNIGGSKLSQDNLTNLKAVESYLNKDLLNPDSDLRKSLRYSRPGISEDVVIDQFVKESDSLMQAMRTKRDAVSTDIQSPDVPRISTPREGSKKSDDPASLVSTPTGAATFTAGNISDVMNGTEIKRLEAKEQSGTPLTEEESKIKTQAIVQNYRINDALKDPSNIKAINTYLNKNQSDYDPAVFDIRTGKREEKVPTTIEGYKENIKELDRKIDFYKTSESYKDYIKGTTGRKGSLREGVINNEYEAKVVKKIFELNKRKEEISNVLSTAIKNSIPLEDLQYSRMYDIAPGEAGNKAKETFIKSANLYPHFDTLIANSGGAFTFPGETELKNSKDAGFSDNLKDLKTKFAEGKINFNNFSIVDMGDTGSSQLVLNYDYGTGDKKQTGSMMVNYDNNSPDTSVIDTWLTEMQKTLDLPGQYTIQSIIDNKQYNGLSVDNTNYARKDGTQSNPGGFSVNQSNKIKEYSKVANASYKNSKEYKQVDYLNVPGREYNMELNKDGFYYLQMRDSKTKEVSALPVGAYLNKEFTKDYLSKKTNTANLINASTTDDKRHMVSYMKDLTKLAENNLIQINNPAFQKASQEYLSALNTSSDNINMQYELTKEYYNTIKNMPIGHKSKKNNL